MLNNYVQVHSRLLKVFIGKKIDFEQLKRDRESMASE